GGRPGGCVRRGRGWAPPPSVGRGGVFCAGGPPPAVNVQATMKGHWGMVVHSPTLRFLIFGAAMYVASSLQGSVEALRSVQTVVHFTQFTIAHAHLGLYAFTAMAFFGGMYFVLPRVMEREWPYPKLILWHFWLCGGGVLLYFVSLTIGGWLQGLAMLDAAKPFMDSVAVTLPYLKVRSIAGALMTAGHLVFAAHFLLLVLKLGPVRHAPATFYPSEGQTA